MSRDQINTSNFSRDDYSGFYPHKFSVSSREHSRYGPSMNPDIFYPNSTYSSYTVPPHLSKFQPVEQEPSQNQLTCAKRDARECELIQEKLGLEWLGIDYSDPNAPYNCFCNNVSTTTGNPLWPGADRFISDIYSIGPNGGAFAWLPAAAAGTAPRYQPSSYDLGDCGKHFAKYVEYSKTNATFWNTPPKTPLYRRAQTALLMYHRIRILVHGDFNIKPGNLINIE